MVVELDNGSLIISLDFELFWGYIDSDSMGRQLTRMKHTRTAASDLIDFFEVNDVKVTWATVGFLMLDGADALMEVMRGDDLPAYKHPRFDNYQTFREALTHEDYTGDLFFAPELVGKLSDSKHQDIGTHTASHYYCLEKGQTQAELDKDVSIAVDIAAQHDICIKSIVFPRNQYDSGALSILRNHGIDIYRGNPDHFIYKTRREDNLLIRALHLLDNYVNIAGSITHPPPLPEAGLYNMKASRFLRPMSRRNHRFRKLQLRRIKNEMTHAAKNNLYYHLWWHPHNFSGCTAENFQFLEEIIDHFKYLKQTYHFSSESMESYVEKVKAYEQNHHDMR
ncbi:polysaccharide deacetylase family protein [Lacicoccus alkaliphilus]|uniref:polysaccharide deacetylase family protein n=1 Tax=Lacicoccus alkaliphilus TaxID=148453 RepID=UPI0039F0D2B5